MPKKTGFSDEEKQRHIKLLTNNLPILRAKLQLSQEELSSIIGISRQTYSSIETLKREMSWNNFLSLVLFFGCNEKTAPMLDGMGILSPRLNELLSTNNRKELL